MKKVKNILRFIPLAALLIVAVGCTEQFDEPEPIRIWTQQEVAQEEGVTFMSIMDFKQKYFYDLYPYDEGSATFLQPLNVTITDNVAISGKVISTDQPGNTYRSIYIQDDSGAIEIKVGLSGLYNDYKVGQELYVLAKGLVLGNYRFMLSLGSESEDASYANGYIDRLVAVRQHIKEGPEGKLTARDTIVVNASNVSILRQNERNYLGRLVRFEGMESVWGRGEGDNFSNTDIYPAFLQSTYAAGQATTYVNWQWEGDAQTGYWRNESGQKWPAPAPGSIRPAYPTWAFRDRGHNYYGSTLFKLGSEYFVVRSSGYSLFALVKLPENGTMVDMTAIFAKYSSSSVRYRKFQIILNSSNDVVKPGTNEPIYKYDRNVNENL